MNRKGSGMSCGNRIKLFHPIIGAVINGGAEVTEKSFGSLLVTRVALESYLVTR